MDYGGQPVTQNITQEETAILGAVVLGQAVFATIQLVGRSSVTALAVSSATVGVVYYELSLSKLK
jgi:hypothetical protein